MATPGDIMDNLEQLDLKGIILEAVEAHKEDYVRHNLDQLYAGMNPEGQKITPEYKPGPYRRKKARMNSAPGEGTPDFYLTGTMHEETKAEVDGEEIEIKSNVDYAKYNEERWGDQEIWGLTPENHSQFVFEELQPMILERISEQTGMT